MNEEVKNKLWVKTMLLFHKYWGCHQLASRSFFVYGYQLPLCARCVGILVGEILSIFFIFNGILLNYKWLFLLLLPMITDGGIQLVSSYESSNTKRVISGFLSGFAIGMLLYKCICCVIEYII